MLNVAVFGITSKQWKIENQDKVLKGLTIREVATIPQLTVLANISSYNAALLKEGLPTKDRFNKLKDEAMSQLKSLSTYKYDYPIESPQLLKFEQSNQSEFDSTLKKLLLVPPPNKNT